MPVTQASGVRNRRSALGLAAAHHQHADAHRDERGERARHWRARRGRSSGISPASTPTIDGREHGDPHRRAARSTAAPGRAAAARRAPCTKKIRLWP